MDAVTDVGAGETQLATFFGGEMVFVADRVELCGVEICRGERHKNFRVVLDAVRGLGSGSPVRLAATELAEALGRPDDLTFAVGVIRNLRDAISRQLARHAGLVCGDNDVIVRDEQGYGFAVTISVSVQFDDASTSSKILAHVRNETLGGEPVNRYGEPVNEPVNSTNEPVFEPINEPVKVDDDVESDLAVETERRQAAILRRLAPGPRLRVSAIVKALGISKATVKREVSALMTAGKVRFDGAPKSGGYVLVGTAAGYADKRRSRSAAPTSASGPSAESR